MRSNWERTRVLVHTSLMPHLKKKMKAKEVMPFEWDNEKTVKKDIATKEEIEKVIQKYRDKNINIISNGIKKGNSKARS